MKYFDVQDLTDLIEELEARRNAAFRGLNKRRLFMATLGSLFQYQEEMVRESIREYQEAASMLKLVREIRSRVEAADKRLANWQRANDKKDLSVIAAALLAFFER